MPWAGGTAGSQGKSHRPRMRVQPCSDRHHQPRLRRGIDADFPSLLTAISLQGGCYVSSVPQELHHAIRISPLRILPLKNRDQNRAAMDFPSSQPIRFPSAASQCACRAQRRRCKSGGLSRVGRPPRLSDLWRGGLTKNGSDQRARVNTCHDVMLQAALRHCI